MYEYDQYVVYESDYKLQKKKVEEKEIFFEKSLQSLVASPSSPECNMSYI